MTVRHTGSAAACRQDRPRRNVASRAVADSARAAVWDLFAYRRAFSQDPNRPPTITKVSRKCRWPLLTPSTSHQLGLGLLNPLRIEAD
jgi:hypothetical protein